MMHVRMHAHTPYVNRDYREPDSREYRTHNTITAPWLHQWSPAEGLVNLGQDRARLGLRGRAGKERPAPNQNSCRPAASSITSMFVYIFKNIHQFRPGGAPTSRSGGILEAALGVLSLGVSWHHVGVS